jgi:polyhydroxybutyrate depolymerase
MVLYVIPTNVPTASQPQVPLMIVLDYLGGNPTFMANFIKAGEHAASGGTVMAFPAHQGTSWNNGLPGNGNTAADIAFLIDVIGDATLNMPVDPAKISMTGYSEGGFMADLFGCTRPDLLTGFGMVAAAQLKTTACETRTPLKMMIFAGTKDSQVPYNGFGTLQSAPVTLTQWENIDACNGTEAATPLLPTVNDGTSVVRHQIPGCPALIYQIVNGGHNWPGAEVTLSTILLGITSQNIDATQTQWEFFAGP